MDELFRIDENISLPPSSSQRKSQLSNELCSDGSAFPRQFQQRCKACQKSWNAAFGIVGTTYIAQPPTECPYCGSTELEKIEDHWDIKPVTTVHDFRNNLNLPLSREEAGVILDSLIEHIDYMKKRLEQNPASSAEDTILLAESLIARIGVLVN
jgi:hypothetical protein